VNLVLLGDIVHQAAPVPALVEQLSMLLDKLSQVSQVVLIAGNHDRALAGLLRRCRWSGGLFKEWNAGQDIFLHGDADANAAARLSTASAAGQRIFMGHEHPAIRIGDGVTTSAKCPCFVLARNLVILPAFSPWAAGTDVRTGEWLSVFARAAEFEQIVAVLGRRLLPIPARKTKAK
jgi:metallophosphoesterase superfamily enzyme